ncbi:hypothetical protein MUK42_08219, partial [Musa troglodytarum]
MIPMIPNLSPSHQYIILQWLAYVIYGGSQPTPSLFFFFFTSPLCYFPLYLFCFHYIIVLKKLCSFLHP